MPLRGNFSAVVFHFITERGIHSAARSLRASYHRTEPILSEEEKGVTEREIDATYQKHDPRNLQDGGLYFLNTTH